MERGDVWGLTIAAARENGNGKHVTVNPGETKRLLRAEPDKKECQATIESVLAIRSEPLAPVPAGELLRIQALVTWAAGTTDLTACIDVGSGSRVSCPASWAFVDVVNEGTVPARVRGIIGIGSHDERPTCTTPPAFITAAGNSGVLEVPPFAHAVDVFMTPPYAGGLVSMTQFADDAGTDVIAVSNNPFPAFGGMIFLHPNARSVIVDNTAGGDVTQTVAFLLDL